MKKIVRVRRIFHPDIDDMSLVGPFYPFDREELVEPPPMMAKHLDVRVVEDVDWRKIRREGGEGTRIHNFGLVLIRGIVLNLEVGLSTHPPALRVRGVEIAMNRRKRALAVHI
jgi:hypothetical protein